MSSEKSAFSKFIRTLFFTTGGLHLINKYIDHQYLNNTTISYGNGRTFTWNKSKIYYRETGEGTVPILLVHDASPDSSGEEWRDLEMYLRPYFRIYTVDLPGCGRSDKRTATYTNYYYVRFLTEFIETIIGRKAVVLTSGLSGSFAVMSAFAHPDLFLSLFMISPADPEKLKAVPDRRSRALRVLLHLPVIGRNVYYIVMNRRNMEYKIHEKLVHNPENLKQRTIRRAYDAAHADEGNGRNLLASREGNYLNWNIDRAVHHLSVPTVIISGSCTKGARTIIHRYQKLNRTITASTIDMAALLPQIEKPSEVSDLIIRETRDIQDR